MKFTKRDLQNQNVNWLTVKNKLQWRRECCKSEGPGHSLPGDKTTRNTGNGLRVTWWSFRQNKWQELNVSWPQTETDGCTPSRSKSDLSGDQSTWTLLTKAVCMPWTLPESTQVTPWPRQARVQSYFRLVHRFLPGHGTFLLSGSHSVFYVILHNCSDRKYVFHWFSSQCYFQVLGDDAGPTAVLLANTMNSSWYLGDYTLNFMLSALCIISHLIFAILSKVGLNLTL